MTADNIEKNSLNNGFNSHRNYYYFWPVVLMIAAGISYSDFLRHVLVENVLVSTIIKTCKQIITSITSLFPYSITEFLIVIVTVFTLFYISKNSKHLTKTYIIQNFRKPIGINKEYIHKTGMTFSVLYLLFTIFYGISYTQTPLKYTMQLGDTIHSQEGLENTTLWLIGLANDLREGANEDSNGVFTPRTTIVEALLEAKQGYQELKKLHPELGKIYVYPKPKPVILSRYWSYTKTSGLYFPFFKEININTNIPSYQLLYTVLHETAHYVGYAREDEANFIGFLAGLHHPSKDFQYAAVLTGLGYCLNDIKNTSPHLYAETIKQLKPSVSKDLADARGFRGRHTGFFSETTKNLNNTYLSLNQQKDGVYSYNNVTDLLVSWHSKSKENGELGSIQTDQEYGSVASR